MKTSANEERTRNAHGSNMYPTNFLKDMPELSKRNNCDSLSFVDWKRISYSPKMQKKCLVLVY